MLGDGASSAHVFQKLADKDAGKKDVAITVKNATPAASSAGTSAKKEPSLNCLWTGLYTLQGMSLIGIPLFGLAPTSEGRAYQALGASLTTLGAAAAITGIAIRNS